MIPERDFSEIRGQEATVRAVAEAVRDRAPILLNGPPGSGKTMIAARIPGLFGPLADHEARWLRAEYESLRPYHGQRPFRAPHHTISMAALTAGRAPYGEIRPPTPACRCKQLVSETCAWHALPKGPMSAHAGEARLARFGILFLDEIAEFHRGAIEGLRGTLRDMGDTAPYLVASSTPCPCGWRGCPVRECTCPESAVSRHLARVTWACSQLRILRRIDVPPVSLDDLRNGSPGPSTRVLRETIGGVS